MKLDLNAHAGSIGLWVLGAAASLAACAGGVGNPGVGSGGAPSTTALGGIGGTGGTGGSIGFGGQPGVGGGAPTCPDLPASGPCDAPSSLMCPHPSACDLAGCTVRCIGGAWVDLCTPCSPPPVACPATPPPQGSACTGAENYGKPCHYDACAAANDFATVTCVAGAFEVEHTLCDPPGCADPKDSSAPCPVSRVCVDTPACQDWSPSCSANPCAHEALSCACAGSLCPSGTACTGTQAGHVLCAPPPGPNDPVMLVKGLTTVSDFQIDGSSIYVTAHAPGAQPEDALFRAPLGGGPTSVLAATDFGLATLAVTPSALYLAELSAGTLRRVPLPSGAPSPFASGESFPLGLVANATHVFWKSSPVSTDSIRGAPLSGGPPTTLLSGPGSSVGSVVVDDQAAYWVGYFDGVVSRQPLDGSAGAALMSGTFIVGLALDATHLYFTDHGAGAVGRVPKAGGPVEIVASGLPGPSGLAVDATHVYWGDGLDLTVRRAPLAGGPVEVLATHQSAALVRLDATYVYWSASGYGSCASVFRMTK
jgi:hypothetical protein